MTYVVWFVRRNAASLLSAAAALLVLWWWSRVGFVLGSLFVLVHFHYEYTRVQRGVHSRQQLYDTDGVPMSTADRDRILAGTGAAPLASDTLRHRSPSSSAAAPPQQREAPPPPLHE